jgi:hypothetical protein
MREDNKILNTLAETMFSTLNRQRVTIDEIEFIINNTRENGYKNLKVALESIALLIEENN